ncbi:MAG: NADH-quinone oxidoreductase subunit NuoG, partial [Pseudomonadota bacterium]|nr:NADH-quinone oxidoreductase subunit NuoG [Pseudomonadota bacterium]
DCPICDQGGECDLQDQALAYGIDTSRFAENKRAVDDKYIGPLVKTVMTRCIQCTRCVRFTAEIAGVPELGTIGRGEDLEITSYLESALSSELQGNVIDLCPVGALTSAPHAYRYRPWELAKHESIDVMDALGSNIRIDVRGREVIRILPRLNEGVNEEWISDKTRFVYDGLKAQRLDRPYVRVDGRLQPATWAEAFGAIAARIRATTPDRIAAVVGDLCAAEEIFAFKDLMTRLGVRSIDCRQDGAQLDPRLGRASYLFNATIGGIDAADAILIVGSNPRLEAPVLNARIRTAWRLSGGRLPIGLIGAERPDLTYRYDYLGAGPDTLRDLVEGGHPFRKALEAAKRPMLILGQGAVARPDGRAVLGLAARLAAETGMLASAEDPEWNGFSVLHTAAARVSGLDIGAVPGEGGLSLPEMLQAAEAGALDVVYLLGADEFPVERLGSAFVVYQGTHGDRGAHRADVILPGAAYAEKSGLYVNTEGRVQLANRPTFPPGDAREDWTILRALSDVLGQRLPYDSLAQLRRALTEAHPQFGHVDEVLAGEAQDVANSATLAGPTERAPFLSPIADFYLTNPIARASVLMAQLSLQAKELRQKATGTHG